MALTAEERNEIDQLKSLVQQLQAQAPSAASAPATMDTVSPSHAGMDWGNKMFNKLPTQGAPVDGTVSPSAVSAMTAKTDAGVIGFSPAPGIHPLKPGEFA